MINNTTFKSFFKFLKNPDYLLSPQKTTTKKIIILLKFYLLSILFLWIARGIDFVFITLKLYGTHNYNLIKYQSFISSDSYKLLALVILISTPIFEEITYRLFLKKFNLIHFLISISLLIGSFIYLVLKNNLWYPQIPYAFGFMPLVYLIMFCIPILFLSHFIVNKIGVHKLEAKWNSNFSILFYAISIVFSIYHLPSLDLSLSHYLFLPILLLPFFIYAIILGFIRIRLGIIYAIILHYIFLIPTFISFLTKNI